MYIISTNHTFYILQTKGFQASLAPSDRFFFRSSGRKKLKSISRGPRRNAFQPSLTSMNRLTSMGFVHVFFGLSGPTCLDATKDDFLFASCLEDTTPALNLSMRMEKLHEPFTANVVLCFKVSQRFKAYIKEEVLISKLAPRLKREMIMIILWHSLSIAKA